MKNEEAQFPGSRISGSIWVTSRGSVGAESLADASGASLREAHISGRFSSKCLAFPYRRLWLLGHRELKSIS